MTILDISTQLAIAYAPTAIGTSQPPQVLDLYPGAVAGAPNLGGLGADPGMGNDWMLYIQVPTAFTSGGAATLDLQLQGCLLDPLFGSAIQTIIDVVGVIPLASLVKGYEQKIKFPRGFKTRYLRLNVIVAGAAFTGGAFNAWLTTDNAQDNNLPAAGYSIS